MQFLNKQSTPHSPSNKLGHSKTMSRLSPISKTSFKAFPKSSLIYSTELSRKANQVIKNPTTAIKWSPSSKQKLKISTHFCYNIHSSQTDADESLRENKAKLLKLKQSSLLEPPQIDSTCFKPLIKKFNVPKFLSKRKQEKANKSAQINPINKEKKVIIKLSPNPSQNQGDPKKIRTSQTKSSHKWLMMNIKGRKQLFQTIKFLDEGSYGKVFLVRHTITNMIFCLKMIQKAELTDEHIQQLTRQIIIQSFVNHPHIVNLYGFSSDSQFIYLLMEPCLGGNLYQKIKQNPLPQKNAKKHLKEVCIALEYLHRFDIIHRDIKPENILLHENTAKICDFGWAVHSPLLRSTKCGTPIYTCPEIVKEESYHTKIDIWCVGVLTYELLYAAAPFQIKTYSDFAKIVYEQISFPSEIKVSKVAKDFMSRCMAKEVNQRMSIRQTLEHPFFSLK